MSRAPARGRVLAAIRTHRWGEEEERLAAALRPVFGDDLAVVFQNRDPAMVPPVPVVDLTAGWAEGQGLRIVPDWGWRCGDYSYYALRAARPDYDFYWLIEPDVHFTSSPAPFFARFGDDRSDALGYRAEAFDKDIRFTRGLPGMAHARAIFALTRLSGRAIDRLMPLRQAYSRRDVTVRDFTNDELFVFSHVAADPDLLMGRLEDRAGDWFEGVQFDTDPDLLFDLVRRRVPKGRAMHPVRSRLSYLNALAARLTAATGVLTRNREALRKLDDADIDLVVAEVARRIRASLDENRRTPHQRRQSRRAKAG